MHVLSAYYQRFLDCLYGLSNGSDWIRLLLDLLALDRESRCVNISMGGIAERQSYNG